MATKNNVFLDVSEANAHAMVKVQSVKTYLTL